MSMGLYAWKGPVVSEVEAARLLHRFYEEGETDVFEASEDVLRFYDELVAKYPDLEAEPSDRVVDMSLPWSVPDDVLDGIVALAREHDLVLYDPQGPSFHSPAELDVVPVRRDPLVLRQVLVGMLIGVALLVGGLVAPIPVLDWIAIVIGVFLTVMGLYSIGVWLKE
jgi:hypothetical protein